MDKTICETEEQIYTERCEAESVSEKATAVRWEEVNARLIPAWNNGLSMIVALLNSNPSEIKKRLLEASAQDICVFIQGLNSEIAVSDSDDRAVLETVRNFAYEVLKHG